MPPRLLQSLPMMEGGLGNAKGGAHDHRTEDAWVRDRARVGADRAERAKQEPLNRLPLDGRCSRRTETAAGPDCRQAGAGTCQFPRDLSVLCRCRADRTGGRAARLDDGVGLGALSRGARRLCTALRIWRVPGALARMERGNARNRADPAVAGVLMGLMVRDAASGGS